MKRVIKSSLAESDRPTLESFSTLMKDLGISRNDFEIRKMWEGIVDKYGHDENEMNYAIEELIYSQPADLW